MNAEDLLAAAREDLTRGFTVRAGTRLRQACDAGSGDALVELVHAVIHGRIPGDAGEVRRRLETAPRLTPSARRLRARWRYAGIGADAAPDRALEDLCDAALAGDTEAQIEMALAWSEHDDPAAYAQSIAWLSQAGAEDLAGASDRETVSVPLEEPAVLREWAEVAANTEAESLADDPEIKLCPGFLSSAECAWLRRHATELLGPSRVYDPRTGKAIDDPIRTGRTACLDPSTPGLFDLRISERLAAAANASVRRAEPLAVLCYGPAQEYKPHYDWLGGTSLASDPLGRAGDRVATVLGYLNTPEAGGATYFPQLDIRVPAEQGQVLIFANVDRKGEPSRRSQHAGEPVLAGEKWVASLWLRERALT